MKNQRDNNDETFDYNFNAIIFYKINDINLIYIINILKV